MLFYASFGETPLLEARATQVGDWLLASTIVWIVLKLKAN